MSCSLCFPTPHNHTGHNKAEKKYRSCSTGEADDLCILKKITLNISKRPIRTVITIYYYFSYKLKLSNLIHVSEDKKFTYQIRKTMLTTFPNIEES